MRPLLAMRCVAIFTLWSTRAFSLSMTSFCFFSESFTQMSGISFISVTNAESRSLPMLSAVIWRTFLSVMSKSLAAIEGVNRR